MHALTHLRMKYFDEHFHECTKNEDCLWLDIVKCITAYPWGISGLHRSGYRGSIVLRGLGPHHPSDFSRRNWRYARTYQPGKKMTAKPSRIPTWDAFFPRQKLGCVAPRHPSQLTLEVTADPRLHARFNSLRMKYYNECTT